MAHELDVAELAWRCPEGWLTWKTLDEIEPARSIVGQDRAVEAIDFGLAIGGVGYNIFVTGLSGTGRLTTIKRFLDSQKGDSAPPNDICYVYNFRSPGRPQVLSLKASAGNRLRGAMDAMIAELAESLGEIINDQAFRKRVDQALGDLKKREEDRISSFEKKVKGSGFELVQIQLGAVTRPDIYAKVNDETVPIEKLGDRVRAGDVTREEARELVSRYNELMSEMEEVFAEVTGLREKMQERAKEVRKEVICPLLDVVVQRAKDTVNDDGAGEYLDGVRTDLEENIDLLMPDDTTDGGGEDPFVRWRVNVVVDNSETKGRPVEIETEPTYTNLFGTIERGLTAQKENAVSFLNIRAGSLLRANGGFLVLNADDMLAEGRVWPSLKRALKYRRVQIQSPESVLLGATTLKPSPVPLDVKVVVIGDRRVYDLLYRLDADFSKVFKVLADFDSLMPPEPDAAKNILSVLRKVGEEEDLVALDRSGMAAILEVAVRQGRFRRHFSSRFSDLADVYREASFRASQDAAALVSGAHIHGAVEARRRRHGMSEEKTHEWIAQGIVKIATEGTCVGQVNGLAVYDLGHHRFGSPSRITARIGLGKEGIINVERSAGLSGPTYDKGVAILTGFLRGTFARRVPLSMACSITFEQSYGGVDGDSASSTEIYAILSALSGLPLRQDVAVTGSVDQYGGIQPIGGVNEKIEGFFEICRARGLTGTQGVMIPVANVPDLQLNGPVVDAVEQGRFHVWSVTSVEEGIELLTGVPAGHQDGDRWTPGSVYGRCQARLEEMARLLRKAGKGTGGEHAEDETAGS
ncbi:MAG: AAA family ATPase [Acidobacteria bacterium]|nr:AAA family ATPase [Acidobacteriota bacterium]